MNEIIAFDHVHFSYESGHEVLSGISFSVRAGESVAIIGPNGAGKSTLLLHTNGTHLATRGQVRVLGQGLSGNSLSHARRSVGLVFQDPDDQLCMPTVEQDVAFGPSNMGLAGPAVEERVREALGAVDSLGLRKRFSHKLSGGEKRRVALATVLAMRPELLVFDEPSAHLDPRSRTRLIELLMGLPQAKIIATHDLDLAWDLCERVLVLKAGRIVFDGGAAEAFSNEEALHGWDLELPMRQHGCPRCRGRS